MESVIQVAGGVCAPQGFRAGGLRSGIAKKPGKKDLAVIVSDVRANAAAVYTLNKVQGAPITLTKRHLLDGRAQAMLCNSGNANTCNADGEEIAREMCELAADALRIASRDVIVASTGVIGQPLPIAPIRSALPALARELADTPEAASNAAEAIMTTDTFEKQISVAFTLGGKLCHIGGMAKGSGMIQPNMATMLAFLTTDAAISPELLKKSLEAAVRETFNMVSVDGDTSTNDMAAILANGMAGNPAIEKEDENFDLFSLALMYVCIYLARSMAKDGEGATKLLECAVSGAPYESAARILAKSVICSSLFKAAMFGADANWGRVLCALGYAPVDFDIHKTKVEFSSRAGRVLVCENGAGVDFDEHEAKKILSENEIEILIDLCQGEGTAVAWGCDLTYDYVKINGDYRS